MLTLRTSLRQLWRDLKAQRLRTLLTALGIVWGTAAVSLLLAFGQGLHLQMRKNFAGIGHGVVMVWPSLTSMPFEGMGKGRAIRVTEADIQRLATGVPGLGAVSSEYLDTFRLQLGRRTLAVGVSGVLPSFSQMRNVIPQRGGRFINAKDEAGRRRVAVLGNELAVQLFGSGDPVGQVFRLHGSPFTVVGVMREKVQNSSYSGRDKDRVFIPASTFRALTGRETVDMFLFAARDVAETEAVTKRVREALARAHRFDPEDEEALGMWDTSEGAKFINVFMLGFQVFLGVVGSLTLVVGGIGVSNIMHVVVEERTPEVGVKMALGSRPRAILQQFLLETLLLTAAGGLLGIVFTAAVCALFPRLGFTVYVGDPQFSPLVGGLTALLLGVIGLVAGYFPARAASRLDPVVAMKM